MGKIRKILQFEKIIYIILIILLWLSLHAKKLYFAVIHICLINYVPARDKIMLSLIISKIKAALLNAGIKYNISQYTIILHGKMYCQPQSREYYRLFSVRVNVQVTSSLTNICEESTKINSTSHERVWSTIDGSFM